MNAYMQLLVRDFNVKSTDMKSRAMAIDTFEMSNIWKRKQPKVKVRESFSCSNTELMCPYKVMNSINNWNFLFF